MLRLNRLTDYAILVLGALAHRHGDVMPTAQLAALTGLNQPTVAKVAKRLQSAGLLETRRGATGGYQLLDRPEDISLVHIVEAVEGPIAVNGCVDGTRDPCGQQLLLHEQSLEQGERGFAERAAGCQPCRSD